MRPGRGLAIGLAVTITVAAGSIAAASVVSIRDADRATGTFSPVAVTTPTSGGATAVTGPMPSSTTVAAASGASGTTGATATPSTPARTPSRGTPAGAAVTGGPTTVDPEPPAPSTTTEPEDDDDTTTSTTEPDDD